MRIDAAQLKSFLLDSGLVAASDIDAAFKRAAETHQKPGDALVAAGKITSQDLGRMQGHMLGIPFVNLEGEKVEQEVLHIIPEPIARTHNIIAYKRTGQDLEVAMLDPEDLRRLNS